MACGILVFQPGIEPGSPAESPNHWTTKELPIFSSFLDKFPYFFHSDCNNLHSINNVLKFPFLYIHYFLFPVFLTRAIWSSMR